MLHTTKELEEFSLDATDGPIGQLKDLYFDDQAWVVRYLVVETGSWLASRKVLISPIAIGKVNAIDKLLPVKISREQVKGSPDIDTAKPVSRQYELNYFSHYGYPYYWGGTGLWAGGLYPSELLPGYVGLGEGEHLEPRSDAPFHDGEIADKALGDPHLRSCEAVAGYHVEANDGAIGHIDDFILDERTWAIRYLVVDTSNWWLGHKVLIAPQWTRKVNWSDSTVSINLSREAVRSSPTYDPSLPLGRNEEMKIYHHYELPSYWTQEAARASTVMTD
jgi:uncharacterized protein YrrD